MITPNLDALANKSLVLKRAHTQIATCAPSRTSFLTSRRPDTTRVYESKKFWRTYTGDFTTLPQYFKENGYHSVGMGKVFHGGSRSSNSDDKDKSWSVDYFQPIGVRENQFWYEFGKNHSWYKVNQSLIDQAGHPLLDQQITINAIETIKSLNTSEKPFFMAVGINKPHLPFVVPEEFYDLYPMESIGLPTNPYAPVDMPIIAWSNYMKNELQRYQDLASYGLTGDINETMPEDLVKTLRRAYYAAMSYADDLIGQILNQLEESGFANDTIIALLSDHGFHLGDNGNWHKHTNFEKATHTPMMIHAPGLTDAGVHTDALTELIDIFPTLVDLAELPRIQRCPEYSRDIKTCTEGTSMVPLIANPTRPWKLGAYTQFRRTRDGVMGYSVRTERYRYSEWLKFNFTTEVYKPIWTNIEGTELYDYLIDPEETVNRVHHEDYQDVVFELRDLLRAGWRSALPYPDPPTTSPPPTSTVKDTSPPVQQTTTTVQPFPTAINSAPPRVTSGISPLLVVLVLIRCIINQN